MDGVKERAVTRHKAPITTLKRGERVLISLHGRMDQTINGWCGDVLSVDAVAIRFEAVAYRFILDWLHSKGERIVPWSRVADVRVLKPGEPL